MGNMQEIKWGIIGCGDVTEVKSGPALSKIAHSSLVAVMRRNGEKARDYAERHKVPRWYDDAAVLIADTEVNMVYVATPPDSHAELSIMAMKAGKGVYCEKPMALSAQECDQMYAASKRYNVPLYIAYYRRAQPYFVKVKSLIDSQAIGKVLAVNLKLLKAAQPSDFNSTTQTWRVDPAVAGGGYFVDLAPHQLDILQFFLGGFEKVSSCVTNQMKRYAAEDSLAVSFQFNSGVVGTGLWCFSVDEKAQEDVIEFVGTHGKLSCSSFSMAPIVLTNAEGETTYPMPLLEHVQQPFIATIVDELRGVSKSPADVSSAMATTAIIDEVLAAYYAK